MRIRRDLVARRGQSAAIAAPRGHNFFYCPPVNPFVPAWSTSGARQVRSGAPRNLQFLHGVFSADFSLD